MFKEGDKVKFRGTDHLRPGVGDLRYEVLKGDVGDVTYVHPSDGWMFVDWHKEEGSAMRMWPEEVELD